MENNDRSSVLKDRGDPERVDPAAEAVERLRRYHAIGTDALQRFPVGAKFDSATIHQLALQESIDIDTARKARLFARRYTKAELEEICQLRGRGGMPLGWSHIRHLMSVQDKSTRSDLQRRAA